MGKAIEKKKNFYPPQQPMTNVFVFGGAYHWIDDDPKRKKKGEDNSRGRIHKHGEVFYWNSEDDK
jgi:hypothetical protein